MEIKLSSKLKSIRRSKNATQEQLAQHLGISSQAVSKWERDEGYPDITLLPKIAGYFHITVDELLGVDEIAKEERIDEITTVYNNIRHHVPLDPGWRIDEGIDLIRNALQELPGVFFFEQLLAADLSWKAEHIDDESEKEKLNSEALELCEDILSRSTEDRWRDAAKQILLVVYSNLGKTEKALDLAYQMPGPRGSLEYMLTYILKDEELHSRLKLNAVLYYQIFRESILKLKADGVMQENMVNYRELEIAGIGAEEYCVAIDNVMIDYS